MTLCVIVETVSLFRLKYICLRYTIIVIYIRPHSYPFLCYDLQVRLLHTKIYINNHLVKLPSSNEQKQSLSHFIHNKIKIYIYDDL